MAYSQLNRANVPSRALMKSGQFSLEAHLEMQGISVGEHFCLGGLLILNSHHG